MGGTKIGGLRAREANLASDPDFYKKIGAIGGKKRRRETRYFYLNRDVAIEAGRRGGKISRRKGIPNGKKQQATSEEEVSS